MDLKDYKNESSHTWPPVQNLPTLHSGMLAAEDKEQRLVSSVAEEAPWSPFILDDLLFFPEGEKPVGDAPEDKRRPLILFISDFSPFMLL